MNQLNKRAITANVIASCGGLFRCPICFARMDLDSGNSLSCRNRHSFDLSRKGYLNFLSRSPKTGYDRRMFEARRIVADTGFFDPLHECIAENLLDRLSFTCGKATLLDAGCGEGSHLGCIRSKLIRHMPADALVTVGMDLSKDGITAAAAAASDSLWCVADIGNCPFGDRRFHGVLNILSPANYNEFRRILTEDGLVVKVVPGKDYLGELRALLYPDSAGRSYTNDRIIEQFSKNAKRTDAKRIRYEAKADGLFLDSLLNMTPLSWGISQDRLQQIRESGLSRVTVDLTVLTGTY